MCRALAAKLGVTLDNIILGNGSILSRGGTRDDTTGCLDFARHDIVVNGSVKIWTIGHSTRSIDNFISLLRENGIKVVADVRMFPGSKRYPQFNRESLAASLGENGIRYEHFPELGGRRKAQPDSRNTAWRNESFRGYADYMETSEFRKGMKRLLDLANATGPTAIMCAEAVWWRCHRSLISDYLKASGIDVIHIMDLGKTEPHPYTSAARIVNGVLSYKAEALL